VADACALLDEWAPTYTTDAGGGIVGVWLLTEPCSDIAVADRLAKDLHSTVADACASNGWDFDSPSPLTGWCPVPGTWNAFRQRHVTILARGERWALEDLREAVPTHQHHASHSPYDGEWNVGLGHRGDSRFKTQARRFRRTPTPWKER
jgi:hypothetical protein